MVNRMAFFYVYVIAERFTSDFGESLLPVLFSPTEPKNRFSRYLVGAPMPQEWFYNYPRNIYRAVSFKTRIWMGWTDFVAW